MASRSKKKSLNDKNNKITKQYVEAINKKEAINSYTPFVMIVALLLLGIFFFMPLTGLNISLDPNELSGNTQTEDSNNSTPDKLELSSSVNSFSIIFNGFSKNKEWINLLTQNMIKGLKEDFSNSLQETINDNINSTITNSQRNMINSVMWLQFYISLSLVSIWLVLIILSIILIKKNSNILPLIILSAILSIVSIAEFLTLIIIALGGMAGTSFTVNFGAYLLPIIGVLLCVALSRIYMLNKKCDKIIKEEQNI